MKTKSILVMLCLAVLLLNGCKSESPQTHQGDNDGYLFDYQKSYDVLKNTVIMGDYKIRLILATLDFAGVQGIQSAEIIEDNKWKNGEVIIAIESEDNAKYKLLLESNYTIFAIQEFETGTYVFAIVE